MAKWRCPTCHDVVTDAEYCWSCDPYSPARHFDMPDVPTRHMVAIPAEEHARLVRAEAEVERLSEQLHMADIDCQTAHAEWEAAQQECERLQARVDDLERELGCVVAHLVGTAGDFDGVAERPWQGVAVLRAEVERLRAVVDRIPDVCHECGVTVMLLPEVTDE